MARFRHGAPKARLVSCRKGRSGGETVVDGIEMLRAQRGEQRVAFREIADHLFDFCDLHPESAPALQRFAAFLTAVEYVPHDHDAHPSRGIPGPVAAQLG